MKNTNYMKDGGVIGQEIVFDDNGETNTGVIKDIHEITGDYVVTTDDGRTVLASKELDVISLGKMRKAEPKKRFSFFEDGGNIEKSDIEYTLKLAIEDNGYNPVSLKSVKKSGQKYIIVVSSYISEEFAEQIISDLNHTLQTSFTLINGSYQKTASGNKSFEIIQSKMEDGGNIEKENNEMLHSQVKEAKHHIDELHNVLTTKTKVEPWVVAKMTRAKTDLSDITHYLDGMPNKMANGGKLTDAQQEKFNKVMHEWKQGKLHSGSANGPIVKDQDQAIAIAYSEAYGMNKMLFGGMVNDLSDDAIDRMEGLAPISTLNELIDNAKYIIVDMENEGFEKDEIMSFLAYKISKIGSGKMATGGGVTSKEEKMIASKAKAIFRDLKKDGYDNFDLAVMTEEEAEETVGEFSDIPDNLKKQVADYLYMLCQNVRFKDGGKMAQGGNVKKGDIYDWHTVEYDSKKGNDYKVVKQVEITDVNNGKVKGRIVGTSSEFIIREPNKYLKKKVSNKMANGGKMSGWKHKSK